MEEKKSESTKRSWWRRRKASNGKNEKSSNFGATSTEPKLKPKQSSGNKSRSRRYGAGSHVSNKSRRDEKHNNIKSRGNYAFIDSQNLNLGVQKSGWKMDWSKFRIWLREKHNVTHAYMFIGYMHENENLYQQMYDHGFLVVLKPTLDIMHVESEATQTKNKENGEAKDRIPVKGNVDADLVLYAMKEMPRYDKAIIISGDGDFFGLIEYLASHKRLKSIMTPNSYYSSLLKPFEAQIDNLESHRRELSYRNFRSRK